MSRVSQIEFEHDSFQGLWFIKLFFFGLSLFQPYSLILMLCGWIETLHDLNIVYSRQQHILSCAPPASEKAQHISMLNSLKFVVCEKILFDSLVVMKSTLIICTQKNYRKIREVAFTNGRSRRLVLLGN